MAEPGLCYYKVKGEGEEAGPDHKGTCTLCYTDYKSLMDRFLIVVGYMF